MNKEDRGFLDEFSFDESHMKPQGDETPNVSTSTPTSTGSDSESEGESKEDELRTSESNEFQLFTTATQVREKKNAANKGASNTGSREIGTMGAAAMLTTGAALALEGTVATAVMTGSALAVAGGALGAAAMYGAKATGESAKRFIAEDKHVKDLEETAKATGNSKDIKAAKDANQRVKRRGVGMMSC